MNNPGQPYQPSNGTEGDWFCNKFCWQCINCNPDPEGAKQCEILMKTLIYNHDDPQYPKEWTYTEQGKPTCTAHVKWDWGNDGDPDDPDNPNKPPEPPDPDQLNLFPLYPTETNFERKETRMEVQYG